jgi:hypothetical protein
VTSLSFTYFNLYCKINKHYKTIIMQFDD